FQAEVGAVPGGEQPSTSHLPGKGGQRILRSRWAGGGVLRGIGNAATGAAIGVSHQHAPKLVHRDVVEVEQVAARVATASVPDAAALDWIRGRCINRGPCAAGIVGKGNIKMPDALEVARLSIAGCGSSQEGKGRAIIVAGNHFSEFSILDP